MSLFREPCAVKAARTALNEGDGETCLKQRALSLPNRQGAPAATQVADRSHLLVRRFGAR